MENELVRVLRDALSLGDTQRLKLRGLDQNLHGIFDPPFYPSDGLSTISREYAQLVTRAELPILNMIVRAVVDRMLIDGVTSEEQSLPELWRWWQSSRLDTNQQMLYSDAMAYGNGYLLVTQGEAGPVFTPESPLVLGVQHDPLNPLGVTVAAKQVDDKWAWLYTDEATYAFERANSPQSWRIVSEVPHNLGVCPVVRFPNRMDSSGRSYSEVIEVLPIQRRINQTIMTRLLLEASAAWRQRWVSGIDVDKGPDGEPVSPFRMAVDKLLIAPDSDTEFGEFSASSTQDLMAAVEQDLRHIAVVTQTPPTLFAVTSISNISSESLAALEGGLTRKVGVKQAQMGEAFEYAMRLGGELVGVAVPDTIEVSWRDLEISSATQRSNAFVQLRGSGLPMEYLLESVLNLTPQTIARVMEMVTAEQALIPPKPVDNRIMDTAEPMMRDQGA